MKSEQTNTRYYCLRTNSAVFKLKSIISHIDVGFEAQIQVVRDVTLDCCEYIVAERTSDIPGIFCKTKCT